MPVTACMPIPCMTQFRCCSHKLLLLLSSAVPCCHQLLLLESSHACCYSNMITITSRCSALPAGQQQLQQAGTTSAGSVTSLLSFPLLGGQAAYSSGAMQQFPAKVVGSAMGCPARSGPCFPQPLYSAGPSFEGQSPSASFRHGSDQVSKPQQYAEQISSSLHSTCHPSSCHHDWAQEHMMSVFVRPSNSSDADARLYQMVVSPWPAQVQLKQLEWCSSLPLF